MITMLAPELLVATVSPRGERVTANPEWEKIFGTGKLWDRLLPEDRRFAEEYCAEASSGSLVSNQAFLVSRAERDHPAPVLLHFIPVRLPQLPYERLPVMVTGEMLQEPASWARDQTKRRRMEMVGQMAMGVAHDFNNLLTTILGHIELLQQELLKEQAGSLQSIERAALDGAALVRKIQRYIRHEKQERFDLLDLSAIVEEAAALTRPYWHNEPRRLGISIEMITEIEAVPPIFGSEPEMREVLVNLILNAVQAMPDGGAITLRVFGDERTVYGEVEDSGIGMPENVRSRIFEPLFTTKGESGTGMGLTVSFGIVEEHDGQISVRSQPGRGTCFSLRFPTAKKERRTLPAAADGEAASIRADERMQILVVDDEPMVRAITARLLRLRAYDVVEAPGGLEALQATREQKFDLVLTDLGMPEMSGRELAFQLRKTQPDMPIVLLTGHTDAEDHSENIDLVVRKPFKVDDLDRRIRELLASKRAVGSAGVTT
jgi:two-component system, cell cycle sensor histidine kinase and response regulator CckA